MIQNHNIYMDNAATTRPIAELSELAARHAEGGWYNPSAMYAPAAEAEGVMSAARRAVLSAAGGQALVFTASGTEANNLCIFGGWRRMGARRLHFITSLYEHPAAYEPFMALKAQGHAVDFVRPSEDGTVKAAAIGALMREDTALVSVMHVSNETGAVNDIKAIADTVKRMNPNTLFHSDGVQGFMKQPVSLRGSKIDYYTVSAHKLHGLKGTGALIMREGLPLSAHILGGGQEKGLRSGTENTLGIAVFGAAVSKYLRNREDYLRRMLSVTDLLKTGLLSIEGVRLLTPENAAPHIVCVTIDGIRGETLLHALEDRGVYVSTGSACSSKKAKESRISSSLRLTPKEAEGVLRISICPANTDREAAIVCDEIKRNVAELRRYIRR